MRGRGHLLSLLDYMKSPLHEMKGAGDVEVRYFIFYRKHVTAAVVHNKSFA